MAAQIAALGRQHKRQVAPILMPPDPLDTVKAAVASDLARTSRVKKNSMMYHMRLSAENMQGMEFTKGRAGAIFCSELDVRAAAHRKWGDGAMLERGRQAAEQRRLQLEQAWQECWAEAERVAEELERQREEELSLRLAEHRLPAFIRTQPYAWGEGYWHIQKFLRCGEGNLADLLVPAIAKQQKKEAEEERQRLLNDSLDAEGLAAFKRDWRYKCFIRSGEADGLQAVLAAARRHAEALLQEQDRLLELDDRLVAAGLPWSYASGAALRSWVQTGEGDVGASVLALHREVDRELELQEALGRNGLLYMQHDECCMQYLAGDVVGSAEDVVQGLLRELADQHIRSLLLHEMLLAERLPVPLVYERPWLWSGFVRDGGDLNATIAQIAAEVCSSYTGQPMAANQP